jgi:hypothetical protein
MNQVTYHHYGTAILNAPIAQLRRDIHTILNVPSNVIPSVGRTTAILEEVTDCGAGSYTLTYRSTMCAPELVEYAASCTLASSADAPQAIFVECKREYRPTAAADHNQLQPFVSSLIDQDRAFASWFAAEYGSAEVFYIDYTLGGA